MQLDVSCIQKNMTAKRYTNKNEFKYSEAVYKFVMNNNNNNEYNIMTSERPPPSEVTAVLDMQNLESDILEERKKMDDFRYPLYDDSYYYVLEAVSFGGSEDITEHVGYMNIKFQSKKEAAYYYDKCNPHMLPLNAYMDYKSQFDPNTKLSYIVRSKNYLG